jgi:hypothetical protein
MGRDATKGASKTTNLISHAVYKGKKLFISKKTMFKLFEFKLFRYK